MTFVAWSAGIPTMPAIIASSRMSTPTTAVSFRVMWLRVSRSPLGAVGRAYALVVGANAYEASENTTNRTSRTIVNCQSRRSTPRRLR